MGGRLETDVFDRGLGKKGEVEWGATRATRHPRSLEIFAHELSMGDLILSWQTDRSAAIGVCEVTRLTTDRQGHRRLYLRPVERFPKPVKLHQLKRTTHPELMTVGALKPGVIATIYETTRPEAFQLLGACGSQLAGDFAS